MKKKIGIAKSAAALAVAMAVGGVGVGATVSNPSGVNELSQQTKSLPAKEVKEVDVVKNRETGKIRMRRGWGTSPKQYGQWLQMRGRQNWIGRSKRHGVQVYRDGNRECS